MLRSQIRETSNLDLMINGILDLGGLESGSYAEKERDDQDDYQRHSFIAPFTTFRGSSGQRKLFVLGEVYYTDVLFS